MKHLLLLVLLIAKNVTAGDWAWNSQAGYTGQVDLGTSGSIGALSTMVSGAANLAGNNAVQPPLVINVQAGSTTSSGSLTPSDACLVFKQGTGWVVNGTTTVASPGYICPDGSISAGIASGRPFYTMPADVDGGYGMVWSGYTSTTGYPISIYAGGAVEACLNLGGWYLPNRAQLQTMFNNRVAINTSALTMPGGQAFASAQYWSSVEGANNSRWYLDFHNGIWTDNGGETSYYRARCVRSY